SASLPAIDRRTRPNAIRRNTRGKPFRAKSSSATNAELVDQRLIAAFVGALEIIEKLATLRDKLEQAPPRMVVLDVSLEMLGEIVDPFGEDRHVHLRRTRIAGLRCISLDDFGLAFVRNRHRSNTSSATGAALQPGQIEHALGNDFTAV